MTKPEDYIKILQEHGTVVSLGNENCPVNDWKTESKKIIRPTTTWHFKFIEAKRFIISKLNRKIVVRGEVAYKSDIGASKSITKRGKYLAQMNPSRIYPGTQLNEAKLSDVGNLLSKHFGTNWPEMQELQFYSNLINLNSSNPVISPEDHCEVQNRHEGLRI